MALHGEIKINHGLIGHWEARRTETRMVPDAPVVYDCTVEYRDVRGYSHTVEFEVEHTFGDGALLLTAKVLTAADEELKARAVA